MSYRDNVDALAARHAALENEVATKTRELDQATRLLDEAKTRARLPVLDNIRVASPCSADWSKMTGDERARHCGDCQKNVYNLSEMTREEAEALIYAKEGRLCVRYFRRHDGTILLKDCVVGVKRKRRRRVIVAGAAAMLAGGAALAFAKFREADRAEPVGHTAGMLMIAPEPELGQVTDEAMIPPRAEDPVEVLGEMKK
jgi:hypothetical protein